jgi:Glycosyltransferase family 87
MDSGASVRIAACIASVLVVVAFAALRVRSVMHTPNVGSDLLPVYDAGLAIVRGHGGSIYAIDPRDPFVYPPTSAIIAALVAQLMSLSSAQWLMAAAEFSSILITSYAAFWLTLRSRWWWPIVASAWLIVLIATNFTSTATWLENLSMLLPPAALLIYCLAAADRWELAMVVLGSTVLIKPLLVPLFVLPLLARRFRLTVITLVAIGVVTLLAALLTGSAGHLASLAHRLATGSDLVGRRASVDNSSLYGFGLRHGLPGAMDVLRVLVVLLFVAAAWRIRRIQDTWGLREYAGVGTLALLTTFLAGSLGELHYLFSVIPGAIVIVVLARSKAVRACVIIAAVIALAPAARAFHHDLAAWEQGQLLLAQIVLFAGIWIDLTMEKSVGSLPVKAPASAGHSEPIPAG